MKEEEEYETKTRYYTFDTLIQNLLMCRLAKSRDQVFVIHVKLLELNPNRLQDS